MENDCTQTRRIAKVKTLTSKEAAKVLDVSVRTFQNWIAGGAKIPCIIIPGNKRRRYLRERILEWFSQQEKVI